MARKAEVKSPALKKGASKKPAGRKSAPGKTLRKRPATAARSSGVRAAGAVRVTVRHYCQGIGDCHLLRFTKDDGNDFWMLIDCGVHTAVTGGASKIREIAADIASATSRLDVIVGTHEHTDHLSGFLTAAETFGGLEVGEIWLGWTENPKDSQAQTLDKYKGQAITALQEASRSLDRASGLGPHLAVVRDGLQSVLGFEFGVQGDRVRAMRNALVALAPDNVRYLEPKDPPVVIPGVPNLRIYVLGPPRDAAMLRIAERASEMYGVAGGWPVAQALANAFAARGDIPDEVDRGAPFDPNMGVMLAPLLKPSALPQSGEVEASLVDFVRNHYLGPEPSKANARQDPDLAWRRIDLDWVGASSDLAIQLDNLTNNSSVVLAFEFIDTARVMLFVADAQVGNWLSWQDLSWRVDNATVTGPDLLARTIFYKVGHHGSHNATLKRKGLELMTHDDFAAFIPTNETDAKKVRWGQMPYRDIVDELGRRAHGRVIRADDDWIAKDTIDTAFPVPSGAIVGLRHKPGLWIELDIA